MIRQALSVAAALVWGMAPALQAQGDSAQCDLQTSHFAVTRAILYIQNASGIQDTTPQALERKQQALDGAQRSLLEAIQGGQETSPAAWYYLGLYYYFSDDFVGADSAFDKVETISPACLSDTKQYRQALWARVANQGIEGLRGGDFDLARDRFRIANALYDEEPTAYFYLGTIFASEDNADSALAAFKAAQQRSVDDTATAEIQEKSLQNVARIYEVLEEWDSAATYFRAYMKIQPGDMDAAMGLARSLISAGDTSGAEAEYDTILANSGDIDPLDLFRIGVALFRMDRTAKAATAFEAGLDKIPFHRNGLFNLTNAYFQMAQDAETPEAAKEHAEKMLGAARKLLEIDPASTGVMRLIAAGQQLSGRSDSTDVWMTRADQMPYDVEIQAAQQTSSGYYLAGTIIAASPAGLAALQDSVTRDSTRLEQIKVTVRSGTDPSTGRPIPAAQRPMLQDRQTRMERALAALRGRLRSFKTTVDVPTFTFEFFDTSGQVIASETIVAQTMEMKDRKQFQLTPAGEGIVGFRYRTQ